MKYKEKSEQHRTLLDLLKNAGYADVQLHLLIFGSTGGMFKLTALHLQSGRLPLKSGQSVAGYALESPQKT